MVAGFARAAGVPYYVVNVICTYQKEFLLWEIRCLKKAIFHVESIPTRNRHMRLMAAKLRRCYKAKLLDLNQRLHRQAHHALIVQLSDGSWWMVDPYLGALYRLNDNPERDHHMSQLAARRNHVVLTSRQEKTLPYVHELDCRLQALELMYEIMEGRFGPNRRYVGWVVKDLANMAIYTEFYKPPHHMKDFAQRLADLCAAGDIHRDNPAHEKMAVALLMRVTGSQSDKRAISLIGQSQKNEELHRRMAWKVIASFLQSLLVTADRLYSHETTKTHDCFEIAWPTTMLGVATLNYLRLHEPVPLSGVLSTLSSSQWVLADDLAAEHEGDTIAPERRQATDLHLARLYNMDARLLVPRFQLYR